MGNIGEIQRVIQVEPLEVPEKPVSKPEPEPQKVPEKEPERVPA